MPQQVLFHYFVLAHLYTLFQALPVHTNTTRSYERTSKMNHTNNNTKNPTSDSKKSNDARKRRIRENSHYNEKDQPAPDNNLFWEDASNPLSSKGN